MIIEESFTVRVTRARAAAYLLDVERVRQCVPGVGEVQEVGPNRYEATLRVQLGPVRSAFRGSVELDTSQAPARLKAFGQGRDRQSGSAAQVEFAADLEETEPGLTTVRAKADVAIRGRLGQFGTGVIKRTAAELIRDFAACANESLRTAAEPYIPDVAGGAGTQPQQPAIGRAALRASARPFVEMLYGVRRRVAALARRVLGTGR